jgi:hypothetical protein
MTLNSTVERYCLHGSTKVNEPVDSKMAAYELVRQGVVVTRGCLMKNVNRYWGKKIKEKRRLWVKLWILRCNILGASGTLLIDWASEDRDKYKNHLRMSREQFVELLSIVRRNIDCELT